MPEQINLAGKLAKHLPPELFALIRKIADIAYHKNMPLYLVGGIVRDLILEQKNYDLDLVVEGNAIGLATVLAEQIGGKLKTHPMFNTAKLSAGKWSVDIAMARTETYTKPGALPAVKPGTIHTDLFRRDFTVNAMALCLSPASYGELIDLYGGLDDLNNKLIRILQGKSFIDDATRIWRALRYEQRLNFQIEPDTLSLLKRDVPMLKTVGGYRLRRELELALAEKEPEKILLRADRLGVLKELHPSLKADKWLIERFREARESGYSAAELYLSIMSSRLSESEFTEFVSHLRFTKQMLIKTKEMRP
jgi:tRNA nucleotidyltransferase (CCA-adding enzyme)